MGQGREFTLLNLFCYFLRSGRGRLGCGCSACRRRSEFGKQMADDDSICPDPVEHWAKGLPDSFEKDNKGDQGVYIHILANEEARYESLAAMA